MPYKVVVHGRSHSLLILYSKWQTEISNGDGIHKNTEMENRFNTICLFFEARSLSSGRALVAAAKPLDRHSPGGRREAAAPAPRLGALGAANRVVRVGEVVVCASAVAVAIRGVIT